MGFQVQYEDLQPVLAAMDGSANPGPILINSATTTYGPAVDLTTNKAHCYHVLVAAGTPGDTLSNSLYAKLGLEVANDDGTGNPGVWRAILNQEVVDQSGIGDIVSNILVDVNGYFVTLDGSSGNNGNNTYTKMIRNANEIGTGIPFRFVRSKILTVGAWSVGTIFDVITLLFNLGICSGAH